MHITSLFLEDGDTTFVLDISSRYYYVPLLRTLAGRGSGQTPRPRNTGLMSSGV